ncbi:MAG: efflux RND transporter permease subunit [Rhodothermales bacterium]
MSNSPFGGPVAYMTRNGVAANLMMVFFLAAGMFSLSHIVQEVFPEINLDTISIRVVYPGATPEEIEESIVQKIEEAIEAVDGIRQITATASEGVGSVSAELRLGADVARVLDEIKAEVDQIQTFPDEAEEPDIRELTSRSSVMKIALYGDVSERALKELAYRFEDEISALPVVSFVETSGIRQYEVSIEVSRKALEGYGLSLPQVANIVRQSSLDMPAGSIETSDKEVRVRTIGQRYTQREFEDLVLISRPDGTTIRLGDVATVRDAFEDNDLISRYNGKPAAFIEVFRTSDERVLDITTAVYGFLEQRMAPALPEGVEYAVWEDAAKIFKDRLGLLLKNGTIGLLLVLIALTLFMNIRLAFWTAVGIAVSFIATLALMMMLGVSINMLTLFGFILAIGIVVDDAIVVGENIYSERERGTPPLDAALRGAKRIAQPVVFAVLTTVTAFTPLLFIPGTLGKILKGIPFVVISVLFFSLIESLFILPHHLSHLPPPHQRPKTRLGRFFEDLQVAVDKALLRFINGPLNRGLDLATRFPVVVIAIALGLIVLSVSLVPAGLLRIQFFPAVEGDIVTASLEMPTGTTVERTRDIAQRLEEAGTRAGARVDADRPDDADPVIDAIYSSIGQTAARGGPRGGTTQIASNIASVQFKLLPAEERDYSSKEFERVWREEMGPVAGIRSLVFASNLFNAGDPVSVELSHTDPNTLTTISQRLQSELAKFQGVFDIMSDQDQAMEEIQLRLKPSARTFGVTLQDVASQVRAAFFGDQALRVQRGREDMRVYVRLPEEERDAISDIEQYRIRVPGGEVPLRQIADVSFGEAPSVIRRKDGRRVVTVSADVNPGIVTGQEVTDQLTSTILPSLQQDYPQLVYSYGGEQEQQAESFGALSRGFIMVLFVMYALLAIPFRSYIQPVIIMSAIPFGIIGALLGHLVMGLSVGMLSLFGIIGLSGVVVNDSLVMIDFINEKRLEGLEMRDAIIEGAKSRFRPILLTSLTTFLGVFPLVLERSLQAQFLIPMATSLAFGIVFATALLMLLVPALAIVQYKFEFWFKKRVLGKAESEIEVVHFSQHLEA